MKKILKKRATYKVSDLVALVASLLSPGILTITGNVARLLAVVADGGLGAVTGKVTGCKREKKKKRKKGQLLEKKMRKKMRKK